MTTNHLNKLDPALVRPGRVSKEIYMVRTAGPHPRARVFGLWSATNLVCHPPASVSWNLESGTCGHSPRRRLRCAACALRQGQLVLEQALQMVQHYFCCLSGGQLSAVEIAAFTSVFQVSSHVAQPYDPHSHPRVRASDGDSAARSY
jgi:hypothetical protein